MKALEIRRQYIELEFRKWRNIRPFGKTVGASLSNIFTDHSKAVLLMWIFHVISVLCLFCFRARLFIDALWLPAGKGLTSCLSFVMSNCEFASFPLVSWVRCGA